MGRMCNCPEIYSIYGTPGRLIKILFQIFFIPLIFIIPVVWSSHPNVMRVDDKPSLSDTSHLKNSTDRTHRSPGRLLCVKFIDIELEKAYISLKDNMRDANSRCNSWALISYKPTTPNMTARVMSINDELTEVAYNSRTQFFYIFHSNATYADGQTSSLKTLLYEKLLPYLSQYKRVWLLDEDFNLKNFNFDYFRYLDCESSPLAHTMVSQPLINGSTYFGYLRMANWTMHPEVVAVPTMYVEQQAPVLDSRFFSWFIRKVVIPFITAYKQVDNGWGHDEAWCQAAKHYLHVNNIIDDAMNFDYSCAIMVMGSTSPVIHENFQTIKKKNSTDYDQKGFNIQRFYAKLFPMYYRRHEDNFVWNTTSLWLNYDNFTTCGEGRRRHTRGKRFVV